MSQSSSTPSHVQSDDSRLRQSLLKEIQRLEGALQSAQLANEYLQDLQKVSAERLGLRVDLNILRETSHGTSSDRITIQKWQDRAEDAERCAEEAQRRAEEAEHRAEEVEHRAEKAERELSRIQGGFTELIKLWRALGQTVVKMEGKIRDDGNDAMFLPGNEGRVDYQGHSIAQASEGEKTDDQAQQSDQASKGEDPATPIGSKNFPLSLQRHQRASYQGLESGNSQASLHPATRIQLGWDYETSMGLRPKISNLPEDVSEHESHLPLQRQRRAGYLGLESSSTGPDTMRDDQ